MNVKFDSQVTMSIPTPTEYGFRCFFKCCGRYKNSISVTELSTITFVAGWEIFRMRKGRTEEK